MKLVIVVIMAVVTMQSWAQKFVFMPQWSAQAQFAGYYVAKERFESELRIARDIQMSMVPSTFPQYEGLDMYAEMNPAREVGGDLYGYVLQGDRLHFCLGDVSGKGVPASLFMSQSARLFRTLATEGLSPVDIAVRTLMCIRLGAVDRPEPK